jgi:pectinesterase
MLGLAGASFVGVQPARADRTPFDAIVGEGGHPSIAAALSVAPISSGSVYRVLIRRGTWREKLTIDRPNVQLVGEERAQSILVGDASAGTIAPDGQPWGTRHSATLTIAAPGFRAEDLTIVNDFDYAGAAMRQETRLQAVALAIVAGADRTNLERVTITGFQDTFLVDAGRTLLQMCDIRGHIDFIFGAGTAYFELCNVHTRRRERRNTHIPVGYITAPSTLRENAYGLVFDRCLLTKDAEVSAGSVALGRPWRPGGNPEAVGQSVFLDCWMDDHIDPAGWHRMRYTDHEGKRRDAEPDEARFFEYRSRGPGAQSSSAARRVLSSGEAAVFARDRVLRDWQPDRD